MQEGRRKGQTIARIGSYFMRLILFTRRAEFDLYTAGLRVSTWSELCVRKDESSQDLDRASKTKDLCEREKISDTVLRIPFWSAVAKLQGEAIQDRAKQFSSSVCKPRRSMNRSTKQQTNPCCVLRSGVRYTQE